MPRRARSPGALYVGMAGTAAIIVVLFLGDFFVELWSVHEFERLPPKERWSAAARLESGSALARRAAERYYFEVFAETGCKSEAPLRALARMGSSRAAPILEALLREWLDRKDETGAFTPCFIVDRLREIGTPARSAKPELVEVLFVSRKRIRTSARRRWWEKVHRSAVVALESVLGERGMAAGILRNELDDPSWMIRLNAVTELGELGPDAALAIDSLISRLEDPQPSIREAAARVLGSLGPVARTAVPGGEEGEEQEEEDEEE